LGGCLRIVFESVFESVFLGCFWVGSWMFFGCFLTGCGDGLGRGIMWFMWGWVREF
jgi:hypothetical protein